jgi:hypothetical protein
MREVIVAAIVALFVVGCVWTAVQRSDVGLLSARQQVASELARLEAKVAAGQTLTETEITFLRQQFGTVVVVNPSAVAALQSPPAVASVQEDVSGTGIDWPALSFMVWALGLEMDRLVTADAVYWETVYGINREALSVKARIGTIQAALSR